MRYLGALFNLELHADSNAITPKKLPTLFTLPARFSFLETPESRISSLNHMPYAMRLAPYALRSTLQLTHGRLETISMRIATLRHYVLRAICFNLRFTAKNVTLLVPLHWKLL